MKLPGKLDIAIRYWEKAYPGTDLEKELKTYIREREKLAFEAARETHRDGQCDPPWWLMYKCFEQWAKEQDEKED